MKKVLFFAIMIMACVANSFATTKEQADFTVRMALCNAEYEGECFAVQKVVREGNMVQVFLMNKEKTHQLVYTVTNAVGTKNVVVTSNPSEVQKNTPSFKGLQEEFHFTNLIKGYSADKNYDNEVVAVLPTQLQDIVKKALDVQ